MGSAVGNTHRGVWSSPGTRIGRWTVFLAGLAAVGAAVLTMAFALGLEPAETFADNWLLTGAGVGVLASGAASVVTGALAILRRHDLSFMVLAATGFGILVTTLMLQQVAEGLGLLSA